MGFHVTKTRFSQLLSAALEELPTEFSGFLEEVPVEICDSPTSEQLQAARVKQNGLLLGLYRGRPRTRRSVLDQASMPDVIYIFQEDVELASDDEEGLVEQVRITVLHEIGHLFGLNEDDLDDLGYG